MKNYGAIFAAVSMTILSVPAIAAPVTTKGGYQYDQNMLSNPSALNWNIEHCSHSGITPDVQEKLAKLMNVTPTNVRYEYCRRILTAYAKGAIPYDDYVKFTRSHVLTVSIARALRISGSGPVKPHRQHHNSSGFHQKWLAVRRSRVRLQNGTAKVVKQKREVGRAAVGSAPR